MLRGIAIIMMVIFHLMWDLWAYRILPDVVLYAGFWKYFQRTTAITFLLLVGISLTVSYRRTEGQENPVAQWRKFVWRGLRIFGMGMCFTVYAWISGSGYVHIGILHLIGLAILLAYPLLPYKWLNLVLWAIFFGVGGLLQGIYLDHNRLVYFGLHKADYRPLDYFPLIPWLGVVLLGIFLGNIVYRAEGRIVALPDLSWLLPIRWLRFLGRHSLVIYIVHQPLLLLILFALGYL